MVYLVSWSPTARLTYFEVLEYLYECWTWKDVNAFIVRTEEVLNLIIYNPLLYSYSGQGEIHKCVLVKRVSLFYRVKSDIIELLIF